MAESASENRRSIAQVNRMIRSIIEAETLENFFWVGGRIDRFYRSELGHVYFDLVDDRSRIRCMIREERASKLPIDLRNHLDIEVYGDIHYYEDRAEPQINVMDLRVSDVSADLAPAVDRLRAKGLYPPTKKPPPTAIRRIGIITSRSSRAIGDFENAYRGAGERAVLAPVLWKYVMLEGDRALRSIVDAIAVLDEDPEIDVLAIMRGGGRSENLAIFDTFEIAFALSQCNKFIVTGIGHHRDRTLADDVADYVASTPTAVAHYLAELCLNSMPEALVNSGRSPEPSRDEGKGSPTHAGASADKSQQQQGAGTSRLPVILVWLLIILAITSVSVLVAIFLSQMQ
ncbi:MAG: exodeoxyribonuclease VII large subunit [Chloroflexi bacterium]|nr:exodeoxyribonuclease VII large subunit [Chloroflexota bacterium]